MSRTDGQLALATPTCCGWIHGKYELTEERDVSTESGLVARPSRAVAASCEGWSLWFNFEMAP